MFLELLLLAQYTLTRVPLVLDAVPMFGWYLVADADTTVPAISAYYRACACSPRS